MLKKILITSLFICKLFALTPFEIATKVKENSDGYGSSKSMMEMLLIDQAKNESSRVMESFSLENTKHDDDNGDKSLMEFQTPLDVKGTKFLTHEKIDKNNNQWLYLPALKRIKRITSKNKSGSFMGSEFSYEDISSREPNKYDYSKNFEEVALDGIECYKYERYPKDQDSGYTKQEVWVDKDRFIVLKIDFYDRKKELLKTATYSGYKKIGKTYRVSNIFMQNHQNFKSTKLNYLKDEIHLKLDESLFTKRYLKD
ncbi:outer membrane lipoprotein-sorting protein [Halarcobacter ebronensis]|uniref:Outer membrane lipoprotein-sorting protein n=1 Tax=Halarcobacter ebronensis TaxID=1462615 RepID=A0A4Q1APY6_9BACT|nr:outer membrane lipoprotein-sorting protein [Halarcobacter ebronensis]QKF82727.1 LolA-like outer membrane lipoprotein-sorting protein [Halarcobacter ebronensis]RXK06752.1 outer membrane lipoprotein-sorting protein [Halarcobacter ebronensis]